MRKISESKITIILLLLLLMKLCNISDKVEYSSKSKKIFPKISNYLKYNSLNEFFNHSINNNTILILEFRYCHNECTPGYTKYFIDLGYNVDILIHESGSDCLSLFKDIDKIRLFTFRNITEIKMNTKNLSLIIKKYSFITLESTEIKNIYLTLYNNLGLLNISNSIFVFHEIRYIIKKYSKYNYQNRIWTLGKFSKGLQVNPHYFGDIKIYKKNSITKFFLTSTVGRNYKNLIDSVIKLKSDNLDFKIFITGRTKLFNSNNISKNISDSFIYHYKASYFELYKIVEKSDFIIIPLEIKNKYDKLFRTTRVTGSAQLSYGFLKPCLINQKFANFYNFNNKNSLLYNDFNLYDTMKKAILLNNQDYQQMRMNLNTNEKKLYHISIENIQKIIKPVQF